MRILIAAATVAAMTTFAVPAFAEPTNLEIVFIKADENGDLTLSKGEILMMAIKQFELTDANGDEILEADEVGDLAKDAEFSDNDTDKSGSISLEEMITEKLADFKRIDADGDGVLTIEELQKAYNVQ